MSRHWRRLLAAIGVAAAAQASFSAAMPVTNFLGTCLDESWAASTAASLGVTVGERDNAGRLRNPLLAPALQQPRYIMEDSRTSKSYTYSTECLAGTATFVGPRASPHASSANGSLVLDIGNWITHALSSSVFAILAQEVVGYNVSYLYNGPDIMIAERMSSVGAGNCTPTHVNIEVWRPSIAASLELFANESFNAGAIGYAGHSGLYTTHDFVLQGLNASPPFYADFWRDYATNDELIDSTRFSLLSDSDLYPPLENGTCPDSENFGCRESCAKSEACTLREADGGECMVVVMMYSSYDPGYLQASMSNLGIPAYFCFLGYDGAIEYVLAAQESGQAVVFYHFEPDLFHQMYPKLFDRVYLPRPLPEEVLKSTGTFGENGYGSRTSNPVAVDFPTTTLAKYAASRIAGLPIGSLVSKFSLAPLNINELLNFFIETSDNPEQYPDPYFGAACRWIQHNYNSWKFWIDPLPLCTFQEHMEYAISGCDESTGSRTITFRWIRPDPSNASLPYACDGGYTVLPAPLKTSRSCEWLEEYERTWWGWIDSKPMCDSSFSTYNISECDSSVSRTVHYSWLLPSPEDATQSVECRNGHLPTDAVIGCEYMPLSSSAFAVIGALAAILALLILAALAFVYINRSAPIIKRSQFELLELMIFGGLFSAGAVIAYAGRPSHFLCALRPILIALSFTTIFGALVVKSLRVYRVFMQKSMKRTTVPTRVMVKVFMGFYLIDLLIFAVWYGVDFPEPTVETVAATDFPGHVDQISCRSSSFVFSGLLMFWKAILLIAGLYLSFLIRNVSMDFQESIWIFSSTVVVLFACLVILPLAYIVKLTASAFYVFLAGTLLLSTAAVIGLMLVPKLLRLREVDRSTYSRSGSATVTVAQVTRG